MISRYVTLPDKTISHAGLLFSIHLSKSIEEGERGADSVGHQQADRASDDNESPDVGQQTHTATDEKNEIPPPRGCELFGSKKLKIIKECCDSLIDSLTGIFRNYARLKSYVSWPNVRKDIEN
jgi:hypothetical protein